MSTDGGVRDVVEQVPVVLYAMDADGVFTLSEGAGLAKLGLEPGEVVGKSVFEAFADVPEALVPVERALAGEAAQATTAVGDQVFETTCVPRLAADGTVAGAYGVSVSVRERPDSKRRLSEYLSAVETTGDAVYAVDGEGRLTMVNEALTSLFDAEEAALLGREFESVLQERAEETPPFVTVGDPGGVPGTPETRLVTLRVADGSRRTYEGKRTPLSTPDGERYGWVGVMRDVTERHHQRQQLVLLQRVLRHDLRNNLNTMLLRTDLVERATDDAEVHEHLAVIRDNVERTLQLSTRVSDMQSALDTDRLSLDSLSLREVVAEVVEAVRGDLPHATVTVAVDPVTVVGMDLLGTAVENAVRNAVEHNHREHPTVHVESRVDASWVELRVVDDGPGIPDEQVALIESRREADRERLAGFGLWLVDWVVSTSGGEVSLSGDEDGSVVTMLLRRAGDAAAGAGADTNPTGTETEEGR